MQKNMGLFLSVLMVFAFVGFNPLGKVYVNEPVSEGDELWFDVNLVNNLRTKFENVNVRAIFDDGDILYAGSFDFDGKSAKRTKILQDVHDKACGEHLVRIVASNDHFRDTRHVYVNVEC